MGEIKTGAEIYHPHRHHRLSQLDFDPDRAQISIAVAMDDDVVERLADGGDEVHAELAPTFFVSFGASRRQQLASGRDGPQGHISMRQRARDLETYHGLSTLAFYHDNADDLRKFPNRYSTVAP
ncbi:MAG TPA: hypothetical protein VGL59_19760 [Polyangia bacterium]